MRKLTVIALLLISVPVLLLVGGCGANKELQQQLQVSQEQLQQAQSQVRQLVESLRQDASEDLGTVVFAAVSTLSAGKGPGIPVMNVTTVARGDRLRSTELVSDKTVFEWQRDSHCLLRFQPAAATKQVDIFPAQESIFRLFDLEAAGLSLREILDHPLMEVSPHGDGQAFLFEVDEEAGKKVNLVLGPGLVPVEMHIEKNGAPFGERYFIGSNGDRGSAFPKCVLTVRHDGPDTTLEIIVLDEVKINLSVSDQELTIADIPASAVVVDYRQDPPAVSRWQEIDPTAMATAMVDRQVSQSLGLLGTSDPLLESPSSRPAHELNSSLLHPAGLAVGQERGVAWYLMIGLGVACGILGLLLVIRGRSGSNRAA